MTGINTNIFSLRNYFPARQYAAIFPSPPDGDTAINTLPTGSFFQANQFQITDQTNSDSSVLAIAGYVVKRLTDAYLAIYLAWQSSELYPAALGPTQQSILKPQKFITDCCNYFTITITPKKEVNMTKNKTTRDTSFSKSWQLKDKIGLDTIRELGEAHGMYGAAERLNASPYVIRYIVHKNEWTRDASKVPHLVKAVQNGRAKASDFKSLDFSNVQVNHKSINGGNSNEKR